MFKQTLNKRIHVSLPIAIIIILAVISIGISFIILLWSKYTGHYNAEIKAELSEIKAAAQEYNSENDSYIGFTTDLIPPKCSDKSYAIQISPDGKHYVSYARLCWSNTRLLQAKRDAFGCIDSNGFFGELEITNIPKDVYSCLLKKEPTLPKDETADWKTYRNEKYGYEVKYPQNWGLEVWPDVRPSYIEHIGILQPYTQVYQQGSFVGKDLSFRAIPLSSLNINDITKKASEINLGQIIAWRYERQIEGPETMILTEEVTLIPNKEYYIEVSELKNYGPTDFNYRSQTIKAIFSTFRFLE